MEAMRPGHALVETALGPVGLAWSARGLTRLQLPASTAADTERMLTASRNGFSRTECSRAAKVALERLLPPPMAALGCALKRYALGEAVDLHAVPIDLAFVGEFRRAVYRAAMGIRFGETVTYGSLAERAGHAGAAREVGQAMGSNPVPLVVPCHRVLAAGGRIGGFSAPGGTVTKQRLLALEGVSLAAPRASQQAAFPF